LPQLFLTGSVHCEDIEISPEFNLASGKIPHVIVTTNHRGLAGESNEMAISWVERARSRSFRACVQLVGQPQQQAVKNSGLIRLSWLAHNESITTKSSESLVSLFAANLPTLDSSGACQNVEFANTYSTPPLIFATATYRTNPEMDFLQAHHHHTPAVTWVEQLSVSGAKICVQRSPDATASQTLLPIFVNVLVASQEWDGAPQLAPQYPKRQFLNVHVNIMKSQLSVEGVCGNHNGDPSDDAGDLRMTGRSFSASYYSQFTIADGVPSLMCPDDQSTNTNSLPSGSSGSNVPPPPPPTENADSGEDSGDLLVPIDRLSPSEQRTYGCSDVPEDDDDPEHAILKINGKSVDTVGDATLTSGFATFNGRHALEHSWNPVTDNAGAKTLGKNDGLGISFWAKPSAVTSASYRSGVQVDTLVTCPYEASLFLTLLGRWAFSVPDSTCSQLYVIESESSMAQIGQWQHVAGSLGPADIPTFQEDSSRANLQCSGIRVLSVEASGTGQDECARRCGANAACSSFVLWPSDLSCKLCSGEDSLIASTTPSATSRLFTRKLGQCAKLYINGNVASSLCDVNFLYTATSRNLLATTDGSSSSLSSRVLIGKYEGSSISSGV